MKRKFTILGCGSSPGVPRIGNDWGACDKNNIKNRRRRAAFLLEQGASDKKSDEKTVVVVDTGPDFREQMIDANISCADGVIFTHAHADHIHGIDDLRSFVINSRKKVNVWADSATSVRLHDGFDYCFKSPEGSQYPPILVEHEIIAGKEFIISGKGGDVEVLAFQQCHGSIHSLGLRFGDVAYCSDVSHFDERALPHLQNLDFLILDTLQYKEHPSHLSLQQSLAWIEKLKPKKTYLTHMHTALDYDKVQKETPENVEPAYDGLTIEIDYK